MPWASDLAELHAPLVERIDAPDDALDENLVLVERDQTRRDRAGSRASMQDDGARMIARMNLVRREAHGLGVRHAGGRSSARTSSSRAASRKGFRLGQHVGEAGQVLFLRAGLDASHRRDEVRAERRGALVQQLEKRMLGIGARLAPDHGARLPRHRPAVARHALAVAFHLELLQEGRQSVQPLRVRAASHGSSAPRKFWFQTPISPRSTGRFCGRRSRCGSARPSRRRPSSRRREAGGADGNRDGQSHRRPERVASAHPVPDPVAVPGVDAEPVHGRIVDGHRHEMPADGRLRQVADEPAPRRLRIELRSPAS